MADHLICIRTADLETPLTASREGVCSICRAPVWVAESSPPTGSVWCLKCAGAKAAKAHARGETFVLGATPKQIEDVIARVKLWG